MFMGTCTGMVRATTLPPPASARLPASSWCQGWSGRLESTVSTFQLIGRRAAADMATSRSISSSENSSRQPSTMPSSVVPSWRPTSVHRAMSSSLLAHRDATGLPSPSLWVRESVVEKPRPPASIDWRSSSTMAAISSAVASRPTDSAPMT